MNCSIVGNLAQNTGGALFISNSSAYIENSLFLNNFLCKECEVDDNFAGENDFDGANIFITNHSVLNVSNLICRNNTGSYTSCVHVDGPSEIYIHNSTFADNTGRAIMSNSYTVITHSFFKNNTTPGPGGAVHVYNTILEVTHSVFDSNRAFGGGAISCGELQQSFTV